MKKITATRYTSEHLIKISAASEIDKQVTHFMGKGDADAPTSTVNVVIAAIDPVRACEGVAWQAGIPPHLLVPNLYCYGRTPEEAKSGLVAQLKRLAAELEDTRIE